MRNIFTLSQKPSRIAGKASRAWSASKNVALIVGQPGEDVMPTVSSPKTTTTAVVATTIARVRRLRRTARRSTSRGLGSQLTGDRSLETGH